MFRGHQVLIILQVLFVREYQNGGRTNLYITNYFVQLLLNFWKPIFISRIHNKYDGVDLVEVMLPETCCLSTYIPQSKIMTPICNLLHVQTHCRNSLFELIIFHLKEQSAFASSIQTQKEDFPILSSFICPLFDCCFHLL